MLVVIVIGILNSLLVIRFLGIEEEVLSDILAKNKIKKKVFGESNE